MQVIRIAKVAATRGKSKKSSISKGIHEKTQSIQEKSQLDIHAHFP